MSPPLSSPTAALSEAKSLVAIDFFCGAGGLTRGLQDAGIKVLAGVDNDPRLKETYEHNNEGKFVCMDVQDMRIGELLKELKVRTNSVALLYAACTPCQPFSTLNRSSRADERANLILSFGKLVLEHPPDFILIENVPGFGSKAKRDGPEIVKKFHRQLRKAGFKHLSEELINAVNYGVPQQRRRYVMLASRHGKIRLPASTTDRAVTLREAISHLPSPGAGAGAAAVPNHVYRVPKPHHLAIIQAVPKDGGSRRDVKDESVLLKCHQGKPNSYRDVFGRMNWDRPAPTITARCADIYCGRFTHPVEDRGITLREAAAIQTFPDEYEFFGSFQHCARQIGNAVPVELARRLGRLIKDNHAEALE